MHCCKLEDLQTKHIDASFVFPVFLGNDSVTMYSGAYHRLSVHYTASSTVQIALSHPGNDINIRSGDKDQGYWGGLLVSLLLKSSFLSSFFLAHSRPEKTL